MSKWTLSLALVIFLSSTMAMAQRRPHPDGRGSIELACKEAFSYGFQQEECRKLATSADQVRGCSKFAYDFQKFDCLKSSGGAGRGGVSACYDAFDYDFQRNECIELGLSGDVVRGCGMFSYDFQKFDCMKKAQAYDGGVIECYKSFDYDFERFDCLALNVSGAKVRHCAAANRSYSSLIMSCIKK